MIKKRRQLLSTTSKITEKEFLTLDLLIDSGWRKVEAQIITYFNSQEMALPNHQMRGILNGFPASTV